SSTIRAFLLSETGVAGGEALDGRAMGMSLLTEGRPAFVVDLKRRVPRGGINQSAGRDDILTCDSAQVSSQLQSSQQVPRIHITIPGGGRVFHRISTLSPPRMCKASRYRRKPHALRRGRRGLT